MKEICLFKTKVGKEDTIAKIAIDLGIDELILIGLGEDRKRQSLLADVFESVLGAIFLDQGYKTSLRVVRKLFFDLIKKCQNDITQIRDPKSLLYEYIQTDSRNIMKFVTIRDQILPNNRHLFEVEVVIDDVVYGRGKAIVNLKLNNKQLKMPYPKLQKLK